MLSNSTDFNQNSNRASPEHMQTNQNVIKDTSPSQEHLQSPSTPAKTPEMSSISERVLDAFKLNRFQSNFKQGLLRPSKTSSRTPAPVINVPYQQQLKQQTQQCHQYLIAFLMSSNSTEFNQI